jgi:hypothetical protein
MLAKPLVILAMLVATAFLVPTASADDDDDGNGGGQTVVFGSDGSETYSLTALAGICATNPAPAVARNEAWAEPIPGTQWISVNNDRGAPNPPPFTCYSRLFSVPENCESGTLSVILHVDNDVALEGPQEPGGIYLNGVFFGSTEPGGPIIDYFKGDPEGPFVYAGPFNPTGNDLQFRVHDYGVVTGLDYQATLTCAGGGDDDDDGGDGDDGDDDDGDDDDRDGLTIF